MTTAKYRYKLQITNYKKNKKTDEPPCTPPYMRPCRPPRFTQAVQQVFGRTVLCRNMEVAGLVSRIGELNCVTIDGDQVSIADWPASGSGVFWGGRLERQSIGLYRVTVD